MITTAGLVLAAGLVMAALAANYGPFKVEKTTVGKVLADPQGMTLYTYAKDSSGMSNCTGQCAQFWPPVTAKAGAKATGDFTLIKRPDGTLQWADKGMPLYTYAEDKKPGDAMGNDVGGIWHAAMAGKSNSAW